MNVFIRLIEILTSRKTFWLFSALLTAYVIIGLILLTKLGGDYWEHLATIYSYSRNLINPDNPYIFSDKPTHLFTPYHLFWGATSKILHIHPYFLLPIIGGLNIIFFIYAANKFSKNIIGNQKYTILMILTMLFFWFQPLGWSGFYHFGFLPTGSVYPYWFVLPLSLLVVALYGEKKNNLFYFFFIPIFPIAFLIHPITGSFLMITTVAKVFTLRNRTWKQKIPLLLIPPLSLLLSFLWPYYPVLDTILNSSKFSSLGFAGTYDIFYTNFIFEISPALLGIPILFILLKKKEYFIPLSLFIFISIYTLNYFIVHSSTLARYIIFIGFFLQILIVIGIRELEGKNIFKYFSTLYIGILLISIPLHIYSSLTQIGVAQAIVDQKPLMQELNLDTYRRFNNMRDYIKPKDIVMANMNSSWKLPAILGCKVVGVLHSNPFMKDYFLRRDQTNLFFNKNTSDKTREEILKKYKVNYILFSKKREGNLINTRYGKLVYEDDEYALLKVL